MDLIHSSALEDLQKAILTEIDQIWSLSGASSDYIGAMRRISLVSPENNGSGPVRLSPWVLLPGLCCQAAGGKPAQAAGVSAAWYLCYSAAHWMDAVQDGDELPAGFSGGEIVNLATGLLFTAGQALGRLGLPGQATSAIQSLFYKRLLEMAGGQHQDLTAAVESLEDYWRLADAKSGAFFALGCRSGAFLATQQEDKLDGYETFGRRLGLLIQVLDDGKDLQPLFDQDFDLAELAVDKKSLPIVYTLEMAAPAERARLAELLSLLRQMPEARQAWVDTIRKNGAGLYLMAETENQRRECLRALKNVEPDLPALEMLTALVEKIAASARARA